MSLHSPQIARKTAPVTTGVKGPLPPGFYDSEDDDSVKKQAVQDNDSPAADAPHQAPPIPEERRPLPPQRRAKKTRMTKGKVTFTGYILEEFEERIKEQLIQANFLP